MGGTLKDPSYEAVCTGKTGHAEVIWLEYDPTKTSYRDLLHYFWCAVAPPITLTHSPRRIHDPTTLNRQGNDVGTQYRSAVFYYSPEQKKDAEDVKKEIENAGRWKNIVTEVHISPVMSASSILTSARADRSRHHLLSR